MANQNTQNNDQADGKFDKNVRTPEEQVRQTEDASLQDDTYSFDEDNTDNEEYHDVDDDSSELTDIFESDDDLQ
ncbi:MAG: hypothetical protein V4598_03315 [Bdellovibrionota bacterium]